FRAAGGTEAEAAAYRPRDRLTRGCPFLKERKQRALAGFLARRVASADSERFMRCCRIALICTRFYKKCDCKKNSLIQAVAREAPWRILVSLKCWSNAESPKSLGGTA